MKNLLIITGAGASYDAADPAFYNVEIERRPPLTDQLFQVGNLKQPGAANNNPLVVEYLISNPNAARIGSERPTAKSLESYLSELRSHKSKEVRKRYWAVPIYLHDLFLAVSNGYIKSKAPGVPSNYTALISAILNSNYEQIIWINLNYDLLADYAIKDSWKNDFKTLDDYMNIKTKEDGLEIKYTKPHGSVDWFYSKNNPMTWDQIRHGKVAIDDNFEESLSKEVYTHYYITEELKYSDDKKKLHAYPAILAPLGKYSYVCNKHIETIIPILKDTASVLCIGFSALDGDVLELIEKHMPKIEKIKMVNKDINQSRDAYQRVKSYYEKNGKKINLIDSYVTCARTFTSFIRSGEVHDWLSQ